MCGIAGYFGAGEEGLLRTMVGRMRHRGPDAEGYHAGPRGGLGHCRLTILDAAGGAQPMRAMHGRVTVAFNGELYNHGFLRERLSREGLVGGTRSDTETILLAYRAWGEEAFSRFDGMFAIALLDEDAGCLYLARDRAGKKPIYWTRHGDAVLFASELKALLAVPGADKLLSMPALASYFLCDAVRSDESLVAGIAKVPPATVLRFSAEGMRRWEFWRPPTVEGPDVGLADLDRLVLQATRARLTHADVPVGVFLSGGLDSSAVAWYASQASGAPLRSFAARFADTSHDESPYARRVAQALGTRHEEIPVTAEDVRALVPRIADLVDEPIADASLIPTYLLARGARPSVTVALSGDGGDELGFGYPTFLAHRWSGLAGPAAPALAAVARLAARRLPSDVRYMGPATVLDRFARGAGKGSVERDVRWRGSFSPETLAPLLLQHQDVVAARFAEEIGRDQDGFPGLARLYFRRYLGDVVLAKVDRASMAASLEVRSPLLDTAVVEAFLRMPWRRNLGWRQGKRVLRQLMRGRLPEDILRRKKHGFALPVSRWLRGELRDVLLDVLAPEALAATGLFRPAAAIALRDAHLRGAEDRGKELWALLVFLLWRTRYGVRVP